MIAIAINYNSWLKYTSDWFEQIELIQCKLYDDPVELIEKHILWLKHSHIDIQDVRKTIASEYLTSHTHWNDSTFLFLGG